MHLVLNHLLDDPRYTDYYEKCGQAGDWITLDNSAHEFQSGQPIEDLLVNAIRIRARELVIPDVLFHAMYTVEAGREAFKFLDGSTLFHACSPTPRLMVVPQGRDEEDWSWCLHQLVDTAQAYGFKDLLTIGLSKDYESYPGFPGGLKHLIQEYCVPYALHHGISTHLLGWTCDWSIVNLSRGFPCLRSTDTAKPFIYAMKGLRLDHAIIPYVTHRPHDYFDWEPSEKELEVCTHNVMVFKAAARGIRNMKDQQVSV